MKVKLKVLEFSSDIFSKSSQLKDIYLSPLFSNIIFNINIFDAISKTSEYEIKVNTPIIKIGLYQGKSFLGIGEIDINKKSQNIKIVSEQNTKQLNNNKIQDNDYYILIECIKSNPVNDKIKKNINGKENKKRKKNTFLNTKVISKLKNYKNAKNNKYKLNNSLKEYINNSCNLLKKSNNKNYESRDDLIIKKKMLNSLDYNNNDDSFFNMKSNSAIMNDEKSKFIQNLLMSENLKNKHSDTKFKEIIFNESFKKEKFKDGVLILNKEKSNNKNIKMNASENIIQKMENIDINDFSILANDFNLIYNYANNNNTIRSNNLKDNFILEYQYFLEKTSDIFDQYIKLSNKINEQNINIKKYIKRLNNDIQSLLKKDIILKIKKQKINFIKLSKSNYLEGLKYFNHEINNINNKLSLVKNINNDIHSLSNNLKKKKYYNKSEILDLFNIIINNEKIKDYLKIDEFFMKYMTKKNVTFKLDDINEKNEDEEKDENEIDNQKENGEEKEKGRENNNLIGEKHNMGSIENNDIDNSINNNEKKINIEILKNKIDKLKNRYLNESIPNDQKNKSNINEKNKKKKDREARSQKKVSSKYSVRNNRSIKNIHKLKKININDNFNIFEINYKDRIYKNYHNYSNNFTPSYNRRSKLMKNDI